MHWTLRFPEVSLLSSRTCHIRWRGSPANPHGPPGRLVAHIMGRRVPTLDPLLRLCASRSLAASFAASPFFDERQGRSPLVKTWPEARSRGEREKGKFRGELLGSSSAWPHSRRRCSAPTGHLANEGRTHHHTHRTMPKRNFFLPGSRNKAANSALDNPT